MGLNEWFTRKVFSSSAAAAIADELRPALHRLLEYNQGLRVMAGLINAPAPTNRNNSKRPLLAM
jgi:hypothetical protein